MASITVTLSGNSSQLHAAYFPPIDLSDGNYVCGLVDLQTFNTIPNIDETNNLFHFELTESIVQRKSKLIPSTSTTKKTADTTQTVVVVDGNNNVIPKDNNEHKKVIQIPTGTYEIEDIAKFLTRYLMKFDVKFDLYGNKNTLKCELYCNCPVDFSQPGTIGSLLGFQPKVLTEGTSHIADFPINIMKINVIRIECDIINGAYINNIAAHTIHQFSPKVDPGYKIVEVPNTIIYFPIIVRSISSINLALVDQNGNSINFRGETITIRLHIKKIN